MLQQSSQLGAAVPGQGLSPPSCSPATRSREEGQGCHGVPGDSPTTESDLLFCITSTTQHMPLPIPKPWAIAPTRLGPSRWHQLDSELQHQEACGSFTVSCSRHWPVYCFSPVVQKPTGMRRHCDTLFHLSGQNLFHRPLKYFVGGNQREKGYLSKSSSTSFSICTRIIVAGLQHPLCNLLGVVDLLSGKTWCHLIRGQCKTVL